MDISRVLLDWFKILEYIYYNGGNMINSTIYRLYVNNQYVDYYGSLKRAKIESRMHLSIGNSVTILEDNLEGTGSLKKVEL